MDNNFNTDLQEELSPFDKQMDIISRMMKLNEERRVQDRVQNKRNLGSQLANLGQSFESYAPTASELSSKTNSVTSAEQMRQQQQDKIRSLLQGSNEANQAGVKSLLDQYQQMEKNRQINDKILEEKRQFDIKNIVDKKQILDAAKNKEFTQDLDTKKYKTGLENQLRDEINKVSQPVQTVANQYGAMSDSAKLQSAAGDISMMYNFMKILDPTSTVREGEYATAAQAGSVPQRILNVYNKAIDGEKLTAEQRQDFINAAKTNLNSRIKLFKTQIEGYKPIVKRNELEEGNVFTWQPEEIKDGIIAPKVKETSTVEKPKNIVDQLKEKIFPVKDDEKERKLKKFDELMKQRGL